ncbi:hypothetical protein F5B17DRAFT_432928 [Nemania serpens]|nr:hypothetical protein F5B17DRAFT_432928 [Nemania serpens]
MPRYIVVETGVGGSSVREVHYSHRHHHHSHPSGPPSHPGPPPFNHYRSPPPPPPLAPRYDPQRVARLSSFPAYGPSHTYESVPRDDRWIYPGQQPRRAPPPPPPSSYSNHEPTYRHVPPPTYFHAPRPSYSTMPRGYSESSRSAYHREDPEPRIRRRRTEDPSRTARDEYVEVIRPTSISEPDSDGPEPDDAYESPRLLLPPPPIPNQERDRSRGRRSYRSSDKKSRR